MEFNHVHINYFDKIVLFSEPKESTDSRFISANRVEMFLKQHDQVLVMFSSLRKDNKAVVINIPIVCEFLDFFPKDISDLPSVHEVESAIDLVPETRHVLMASYRMFVSELSKLKKQLKDLL